jgi:hypothetical protein
MAEVGTGLKLGRARAAASGAGTQAAPGRRGGAGHSVKLRERPTAIVLSFPDGVEVRTPRPRMQRMEQATDRAADAPAPYQATNRSSAAFVGKGEG